MKYDLYVNGAWIPAECGNTISVVDPASEQVFATVPAGGASEIDAAVRAAKEAFHLVWRHTSGKQRAAYLNRIADLIEQNTERLAKLEVQDNGKPLPEAVWDIEDTAGCFRYYASLAEKLDHQKTTVDLSDKRFESKVVQEPLGVAGLIVPWNYPMLMAAWKVAPALAAGCTAVLKPSEITPCTALELARLAEEAGLPAGVLNVVTGYGHEAGAALAAHKHVNKLAFTGSVATGKKVMAAATENLTPVTLELGGKSPFIVFEDSDLEKAVEWIMFGIFWNKGEVCSATSRLLVQESIYDALMLKLKKAVTEIPTGNGNAESIKLGPLVCQTQYQKVIGFIERAKNEGLTPTVGGARPVGLDTGYFIEPTIFEDVPLTHELWTEEIFGPILCARKFSSEEEAIQLANDSDFGLAGAVMSADKDRCDRVAAALEAGIVWINCSQPTFCEAPWGGRKQSGLGRELGPWGLQNYLSIKQITSYDTDHKWGWYGHG